jgi:hypothetical protein
MKVLSFADSREFTRIRVEKKLKSAAPVVQLKARNKSTKINIVVNIVVQ